MTPEAVKQLQEILKQIITGLYHEMGEAWCTKMIKAVNELDSIGNP